MQKKHQPSVPTRSGPLTFITKTFASTAIALGLLAGAASIGQAIDIDQGQSLVLADLGGKSFDAAGPRAKRIAVDQDWGRPVCSMVRDVETLKVRAHGRHAVDLVLARRQSVAQ